MTLRTRQMRGTRKERNQEATKGGCRDPGQDNGSAMATGNRSEMKAGLGGPTGGPTDKMAPREEAGPRVPG